MVYGYQETLILSITLIKYQAANLEPSNYQFISQF